MAAGTEPLSLEERVAALEEAMGLRPSTWPALTEAETAELKEQIAQVLQGPFTHRAIPQPPPLSPDEIRRLLRECVTVVRPGETLLIRVPLTWTPDQVSRYARQVNDMHEAMELPFRALVVPAGSIGLAEVAEDDPGAP
jgi:hypothetical protein